MAGSSFGTLFKITTWGESHGTGLGVVVDGCPAGVSLCEDDIQIYLNRRKPGQNKFTTARAESDTVQILSGVFEGRTTGTPISLLVMNKDQRSKDYSEIASYYRPGHADLPFDQKYGFRDYRGGGRSSGRETIGRVAAGAIAAKILGELGISITCYTSSIGDVTCSSDKSDFDYIQDSDLYMPDRDAEMRAHSLLEECMRKGVSVGATVTCHVHNMKPGIGEPVFDKLDACLGKALFSIGAVKAVEIGDGIKVSLSTGDENNDMYCLSENGTPQKCSNHGGGIYGGMSDGDELRIKVHFKPTPSISAPQNALFKDGSVREISIHGRHDPIIAPRAVVVVESMTAITLLDLIMQNMTATIDGIRRFYNSWE